MTLVRLRDVCAQLHSTALSQRCGGAAGIKIMFAALKQQQQHQQKMGRGSEVYQKFKIAIESPQVLFWFTFFDEAPLQKRKIRMIRMILLKPNSSTKNQGYEVQRFRGLLQKSEPK